MSKLYDNNIKILTTPHGDFYCIGVDLRTQRKSQAIYFFLGYGYIIC